MDTGITIALIFGGAQIVASALMMSSTISTNKNGILKKRNREFAKAIYFYRVLEESVYKELAETNSPNKAEGIKRKIHSVVKNYLGYPYVNLDTKIMDSIDDEMKPIEAQDISSYR